MYTIIPNIFQEVFMPVFGVISGSGLYDIPGLEITDSVKINTPYGDPSDFYRLGRFLGKEVVFLPRHGIPHYIQPHKINYRANLWGFRELNVEKIISIGASGGISPEMKPGTITLPDQIIDTTSNRVSSFYEEHEVVHIDFTEPFCPDLRSYIIRASEESGVLTIKKGNYVCTNGPRLETAAEIKTFSLWGADMVGMTAMPEAALARELEICFAGISVITNFAAGLAGKKLTTSEVVENMQAATERLKKLLQTLFGLQFSVPLCSCGQTLKEAKM
jgi:5'-methylthioadenosine phosphorylase